MATQAQIPPGERAGTVAYDGRDPRRWWALGALSLALFMAILDNTVVNVALPHIQSGLKTSISDLQWVVSAYSLVFGSLLISGGKLGDLLGRKRVFLSGLTLFIAGSVLSGFAPNIESLHAFRALQGLGGAAIFPLTLAIINSTFEGKERATAISLWGGISGLAVALGPVLGGLLVDNVSWRAVFFVNVPFGVLVAALALYAVRDSRDMTAKGGIDWLGTALSTATLFLIIFALIRTDAAGWGWGSRNNVLTLAAGFVLLGVFLTTEYLISRRGGEPMVDLSFFRNPIFSAANAVAFLVSLGMFGAFFYISIYLQSVLGYSAMGAGMRTLPVAAGVVLGAPISGQLAGRFGPRWPLSIGMFVAAIGVFLWALLMSPTATYTHFVVALPLFGFGLGIVFPAIGTAILNTVPRDKSGVATGINDMSREVGGTFGVALMAAIFNPIYHSGITDKAAAAGLPAALTAGLRQSAGTGARAAGIPDELASTVHGVVESAYVSGMQTVLFVATALLIGGAIVAFTFMRGARAEEPVFEEDELQYAAAD